MLTKTRTGIDIGNGREQGGLALSDQIAGGHLARAGDAVDGRRDRAILHVQFGLADAGIRRFHGRLRLLDRRHLVHFGGIERCLLALTSALAACWAASASS